MRTLLLAALDAIVAVVVLLVVGRWVEGIGVSECADGVVRYQGGCFPSQTVTSRIRCIAPTGLSQDQRANALWAFAKPWTM